MTGNLALAVVGVTYITVRGAVDIVRASLAYRTARRRDQAKQAGAS